AFRNSQRQEYRFRDPMAIRAVRSEYSKWRLMLRETSGSPAMATTEFTVFSAAIRTNLFFINSMTEATHSVSYSPRMERGGSPMAADWTVKTRAVSRSTRSLTERCTSNFYISWDKRSKAWRSIHKATHGSLPRGTVRSTHSGLMALGSDISP